MLDNTKSTKHTQTLQQVLQVFKANLEASKHLVQQFIQQKINLILIYTR